MILVTMIVPFRTMVLIAAAGVAIVPVLFIVMAASIIRALLK